MNPLTPSLMLPGNVDQLPGSLEDWLGRPSWHRLAACRGSGVAHFVRGPKAEYGDLRALCGRCPVRQECLATALADPDLQGLWGGTTDAERREMRKRVA